MVIAGIIQMPTPDTIQMPTPDTIQMPTPDTVQTETLDTIGETDPRAANSLLHAIGCGIGGGFLAS